MRSDGSCAVSNIAAAFAVSAVDGVAISSNMGIPRWPIHGASSGEKLMSPRPRAVVFPPNQNRSVATDP